MEFKRSDCVPSDPCLFNGGNNGIQKKPHYPVPRTGDTHRSPVYKTMEEKTDEFMARKRDIHEKHANLIREEVPLQARLQKWEIALRKKEIPLTSITSGKKKQQQVTIHKYTLENSYGAKDNTVSKALMNKF